MDDGRMEMGNWKLEIGNGKWEIFGLRVDRKKAGFVPKKTCAPGGRVSWALALARKRKTDTASFPDFKRGRVRPRS